MHMLMQGACKFNRPDRTEFALLHSLGVTTGSIFVVLAGRVVGSWAIKGRRVVVAGVRIANATDVADSANTLGC